MFSIIEILLNSQISSSWVAFLVPYHNFNWFFWWLVFLLSCEKKFEEEFGKNMIFSQ